MPLLAHRGDRPACEGNAEKGNVVRTFQIHTMQTAPAEGIPALRTLEQGLGFVPNLAAAMAESSALITGFVDLRKTLAATGTLTGAERESSRWPSASKTTVITAGRPTQPSR